MDNSKIHPSSESLAHLIDLFLFKGPPINNDPDNEVQILVNHGYVLGFSPQRLQPLWAAYRVAHADRSVDYDRPHLYYVDDRLTPEHRLGPETFGKKDGIQYHVGHMVPNEVINVQFGRLAQMETFFMSNMSPQRGSLNTGVWLSLENAIRNIEDTDAKDHVWAIAGPIFDETPESIVRPNGLEVPIPTEYYYISIDPFRYPWDREGNVDIACFRIPQTAKRGTKLSKFIVELDEIEEITNLTFLPGWDRDIGESETLESIDNSWNRHRLLKQFL